MERTEIQQKQENLPVSENVDESADTEETLKRAFEFYIGEGVDKNYSKAAELFLQAAELGNNVAQFSLGVLHQNGQGVPINYEIAAMWYRRSAMNDNPSAQYLLGLSYREGSGVAKSYLMAFKWLDLAADHGNADVVQARNQLALLMTADMVAKGRRLSDQFRVQERTHNDNDEDKALEFLQIEAQSNKALKSYRKALARDLKQLGKNHPDVAINYHNMALAYKAKKDLAKAREYWEKAHAIQIKRLGPNHPHTKRTKTELGKLTKESGRK